MKLQKWPTYIQLYLCLAGDGFIMPVSIQLWAIICHRAGELSYCNFPVYEELSMPCDVEMGVFYMFKTYVYDSFVWIVGLWLLLIS